MPTTVDNEPVAYCENCSCDLWDETDIYEYDGYGYCESCYNNLRYDSDQSDSEWIRDHDFKPTPYFHMDNGRRSHNQPYVAGHPQIAFGLEIETESTGVWEPEDGAEFITNECNGLVYCKSDGSLDHGFEIVTHPMSYKYAHDADFLWSSLNHLRKKGFKAWQTSTCGLHIHISRNAFLNDGHKQKFFYFMFGSANKNARDCSHIASIKKFAGRDTHWSKFDREAFLGECPVGRDDDGTYIFGAPTLGDIAKGYTVNKKTGERMPTSGAADRYLAVNRNPRHTFELRFFRPSLRPATALACIEFTQCVFDYTEVVTSGDIMNRGALSSFQMLGEFAMSHKDKYAGFVARAKARGVLKDGSENHDDDGDNNC